MCAVGALGDFLLHVFEPLLADVGPQLAYRELLRVLGGSDSILAWRGLFLLTRLSVSLVELEEQISGRQGRGWHLAETQLKVSELLLERSVAGGLLRLLVGGERRRNSV